MPSRAVTSFLPKRAIYRKWWKNFCVNALSGCYLISTLDIGWDCFQRRFWCQCPLGLLPHFYGKLTGQIWWNDYPCQCPLGLLPHFYGLKSNRISQQGERCQCPLGLLPHFYSDMFEAIAVWWELGVNALSGCYLISTVPLQKPRFYAVSRTCFCRYLSEYSDNSCFSCMLTIWTYLTRYTYL